MANRQDLRNLVQTFLANRALTLDLLQSLGSEDLERVWPRPGLDSFSKHLNEMAQVQRAFIKALSTGTMDFTSVPDVFGFPSGSPRESLLAELNAADEELQARVEEVDPEQVVDWGDEMRIPADQHLVNLVSHEVFHQGMMVMAMYLFQIPIPESWIFNWALPQATVTESND